MNNLYLCSVMGYGKDQGKQLAVSMGRQFLDLDSFLEKKRIQALRTTKQGKTLFNDPKQQALLQIWNMQNAVIFIGDKTFDLEENIVLAKKSGTIVYLYYPFEACYKKIKGSRRQLLKNNDVKMAKGTLVARYNRLHTLYKIAANHIFDFTFCPQLQAKEIAGLMTK